MQSAARSTTLHRFKAKANRGSLWALVGYGGGQVLRLAGNLILWRLLYADAFGLMAIVNVFMTGLAMFSDVGIGPSIVQSERGDDPVYLRTAWTIQIARGIGLFAVACAFGVPVARFYGEPALAPLIPAVAASSILAGLNSTKLFTVTRAIALGPITAIDLASQGAGLAAMVGFALAHRSIWALVIGGIVTAAVRMVMTHACLPGVRDKLFWDPAAARSLLRFGRWIFISTLLTFVAMQSDRLIFGKLVTMSELGVYSIATIWASFPTQILGHIFQSSVFPTLSRLREEQADLGEPHAELRAPWLIATGWLTACLVSGGPPLVHLLYDQRAATAGVIIPILAAGAWFLALEITNGSALLALGRPKWVAAAGAAKLVGMIAFIPLGMWQFGFRGAVAGFAASEIFRYAASAIGASACGVRGFKQDGALTLAVAVTSVLGLLTSEMFRRVFGQYEDNRLLALAQGATIFAVVTTAWAVIYAMHRRRAAQRLVLA